LNGEIFFDHIFSDDIGNILFGKGTSSHKISLMSPDTTSDGWLKKKWAILDGERCLIKGGSGVTQQEQYNEVLASRGMDRFEIPRVSYALMLQDGHPYSVYRNFITSQTELIPAWYIMQTILLPTRIVIQTILERFGIQIHWNGLVWLPFTTVVLPYGFLNRWCLFLPVQRRHVIRSRLTTRNKLGWYHLLIGLIDQRLKMLMRNFTKF
jgi:hypothetical protein